MAYEVFDNRMARRVGSPQLTIRSGKIAINSVAGDHLAGLASDFVHILWDDRECRLAIKPVAKEDDRTLRVSIPSGRRGGTIAAQSFLNYIQWNAKSAVAIEAHWNEGAGILEARLPKEYVGAAKRQIRKI